MNSAPLPSNPVATKVNSTIKNIELALEPLIEAYLISVVPALGIPVIKQIAAGLEEIIENKLTKYIEQGATDIVIDAQVESEVSNLGSGGTSESSAAQDALVADDGIARPI